MKEADKLFEQLIANDQAIDKKIDGMLKGEPNPTGNGQGKVPQITYLDKGGQVNESPQGKDN